jgi:hypothetical protein
MEKAVRSYQDLVAWQIARNLGYTENEDLDHLLSLSAEVGRILNGLIASLRNKI